MVTANDLAHARRGRLFQVALLLTISAVVVVLSSETPSQASTKFKATTIYLVSSSHVPPGFTYKIESLPNGTDFSVASLVHLVGSKACPVGRREIFVAPRSGRIQGILASGGVACANPTFALRAFRSLLQSHISPVDWVRDKTFVTTITSETYRASRAESSQFGGPTFLFISTVGSSVNVDILVGGSRYATMSYLVRSVDHLQAIVLR